MLETQGSAAIHADDAQPAAPVRVPAPKAFSRKFIFLILFAALLVNAAMVLVGLPKVSSALRLTYSMSFGDFYDMIAKNLAQGNGYRLDPAMGNTMLREPGYPLLLAAVFKLGGYGIQQARVACVLLAFGAALILLRLTRKITGDAMTALAAALLFLLYPGVLVAETRAGIEIPSIFTVMLFMLALYGAVKKESLWRYGAAGLLLGAAVVVRSEVLLFPVLLLIYLLFAAKGWAERWKVVERIAVLALGTAAVMSPWIIRNYRLVHSFVPTATVAGVAAQTGLYTCENASSDEPFFLTDTKAGLDRAEMAKQLHIPFVGARYYQIFYTPQGELEFDRALRKSVSAEYRSHPGILASCVSRNLLFNFWFLGKTPKSVLLNALVQAPLLALALAGIVVLWKQKLLRNAGIILLYIVYIPAVHAPILAQARYSMLVVPFLTILAAVFLVSAGRRLRASFGLTGGFHRIPIARPKASALRSVLPAASPSVIDETRVALEPMPAHRNEMELSIVIPAYNEEARLPRTVLETIRWCTSRGLTFELIIVDDGSRDETLALSRLFEEKDVRVRALACPHLGKGAAVRTGMLNAKGRFVLFMDADGATPMDEIPKLLAAVEDRYDVAIGSRVAQRPGEIEVRMPLHRQLIGRGFAALVKIFALDGISDTQCGFKMFRREAAAAIFSRQKLAGFAFDVEILFIARRLSLSIAEIPVNWVAQPGSKVNFIADSVRMQWDISRIHWVHRNLPPRRSAGRGICAGVGAEP